MTAFSCAAGAKQHDIVVGRTQVTGLLLCPSLPVYAHAVAVAPTEALFAQLVQSLSAADEPRSRLPCPAYADLVQTVIARTASVTFIVHLPIDGCSHYRHEVLQALSAARSGR